MSPNCFTIAWLLLLLFHSYRTWRDIIFWDMMCLMIELSFIDATVFYWVIKLYFLNSFTRLKSKGTLCGNASCMHLLQKTGFQYVALYFSISWDNLHFIYPWFAHHRLFFFTQQIVMAYTLKKCITLLLVVSNGHFDQRFHVRKLQYITELERNVSALQVMRWKNLFLS